MRCSQAAAIIGCSPQQVRTLIRQGNITAKKIAMPGGYYYDVSKREAARYRDLPQKQGWPRGQLYTLIQKTGETE